MSAVPSVPSSNHPAPPTGIPKKQSSEPHPYAEEPALYKAAGRLSTIAGGSAAIGLLVKVMGASDEQATVLSVFLMTMTYILLYRRQLEARVKSSFLLAVFTVLLFGGIGFKTTLSSWLLNQTISKTTGIVEYSPRANDFLPHLRTYITAAHDEVWFTGISFYVTLPQYRDLLLKKLAEGVNVRFLIYNPLSPNVNEVAGGFTQNVPELLSECDMTVQHLRAIKAEWEKHPTSSAKFEVRLFSNIPRSRIYIFDRRSESGYTYFIPHIDNQNTINLPGFLVQNIKTGIAPAYFEGIEHTWQNAVEFDKWLPEYDAYKRKAH